jgi:hypothetical protein
MVAVRTALRSTLPTERATEHLGEDVGPREVALGSLGAPEPVEVLALLGVREDLISLLDLFELLSVTALVRVVLAGKFVVGLADGAFVGGAVQPKDAIRVHLNFSMELVL